MTPTPTAPPEPAGPRPAAESAIRLRSREGIYIVSVASLTAVLLLLTGPVLSPVVVLLAVALVLGPLGIGPLVLAVVVLTISPGGAWPLSLVLDPLVLAAVVGTAWVNTRMARSVLRNAAAVPPPPRYRSRVPIGWDRLLAAALFGLAGEAFVLLCVAAGFTAFVAHGIDAPAPEPQASRTVALAGATWVAGAVAAIGGLVLWVSGLRRGSAVLAWAIADLLVVVGAGTVLLVATG